MSSSPHGAVGPSGLREKDITLELGRRVAQRLGGSAVLTRDGDFNLSLGQRAAIARSQDADVFLSLHANGGGYGTRGSEVWVHPRAGQPSHALARAIGRELALLGVPDRGVHTGEMAVLSPERLGGRTAACLIEVDYLSDPEGERRLRDPIALDGIAQAIARGAEQARLGGAAAAHAQGAFATAMAGTPVPFSWPSVTNGNYTPSFWLDPGDRVQVTSGAIRVSGTSAATTYRVTLDVYGTSWVNVQTSAPFQINGSTYDITPIWNASRNPGNHRIGVFIDQVDSNDARYNIDGAYTVITP